MNQKRHMDPGISNIKETPLQGSENARQWHFYSDKIYNG